MIDRAKQVLAGVLGAVVALGLLQVVHTALAGSDGSDATEEVPRVIPWEGTVALDDVPWDGPLGMRFTLYDAQGASVWTETWDAASGRVQVDDGAFSVLLGAHTSLSDAVADAADLSLGVEVDGGDGWTALGGRQRLTVAPYGLWASQSSDLTVAGDLDVGGAVSVARGVVSRDSLTVAGDVTLGASSSGSAQSGPHGLRFGDPDTGAQLLYRTTPHALRLEQRNDGQTGTVRLDIDTVTGALVAGGGAQIGGDLSLAGDLSLTGDFSLVLGGDTTPEDFTGALDPTWLVLGGGAAVSALTFRADVGGADLSLSLAYYPEVHVLYLEKGPPDATAPPSGDRVLAINGETKSVGVGGYLHSSTNIVAKRFMNGYSADECLEDDRLDKMFWSDTSCSSGAVRIMVDTGPSPDQVGLCACFTGTEQNQKSTTGWHCFM